VRVEREEGKKRGREVRNRFSGLSKQSSLQFALFGQVGIGALNENRKESSRSEDSAKIKLEFPKFSTRIQNRIQPFLLLSLSIYPVEQSILYQSEQI